MDPETKKLLEENLALAKETNHLMKKIISAQRWGRVIHIIYWVIILGGSVGTYYLIQPYINQLLGGYESILSGVESVQKTTQSLPDSSSINSILNNLLQKQ
ncbi:MAG: hypothetical protein AAB428_01360 [Patescibacteria group bacterium]